MEKISFRFKFSPLIWVLIALVSILLLLGVYFNVKNLLDFWSFDTLETITFILSGVVDLLLLTATVIGTLNSKYIISKDCLKIRCFVFTKKVDLNDIAEAVLFINLEKLVLRFSNGEYTVVLIKKENHQSFVDVLKQKNPKIVYGEETAENKN